MTLILISFLMMIMVESPIMMVMLLIFITLLLSMMIFKLTMTAWISFIIFLMMVGGLMILFLYMASITPNKKFFNIKKNTILKTTFMMFILNLILMKKNMFFPLNSSITIYTMVNNLLFMTFSILYLFIFLFSLSIIIKKKEGPLRST